MSGNKATKVYDDDFDDLDYLPDVRNMPKPKARPGGKLRPNRKPKPKAPEIAVQLTDQADDREAFNFSYRASRHEYGWLIQSLGGFYEQHWLDDVLHLVKGGKEANVYLCKANPSVVNLDQPYLAAKVYRPRQFRNLRNDHMYREGRPALDESGLVIFDDRKLRAMQKQTAFGQTLTHTSWIEYEVQALTVLHQAGADVPFPYARGNNAILMTYIGNEDEPAPTLNTIDLQNKEARRLFERVLHNIELMLANNRVHGDLSAYNILYWDGEITLIDFPQVVEPDGNRSAYKIFERDVVRVCEYFARQGVHANPRRLAADLWNSHGHRMAPEVHPALLDAENKADRAFWQQQNKGVLDRQLRRS